MFPPPMNLYSSDGGIFVAQLALHSQENEQDMSQCATDASFHSSMAFKHRTSRDENEILAPPSQAAPLLKESSFRSPGVLTSN